MSTMMDDNEGRSIPSDCIGGCPRAICECFPDSNSREDYAYALTSARAEIERLTRDLKTVQDECFKQMQMGNDLDMQNATLRADLEKARAREIKVRWIELTRPVGHFSAFVGDICVGGASKAGDAFGPRGAFLGNYPTEPEARAAVEDAAIEAMANKI